jgi:hypothetical protein
MTLSKDIKDANERSIKYMSETLELVKDIKRNVPDWRSRLSPKVVKMIRQLDKEKKP